MGRPKTGQRSYAEQMQRLVSDYRDAGQTWPTTRRNIARWLIRNKKWNRGEQAIVDICSRDISRAMREEYYTDPQGRHVRAKHAAKFPLPGSDDGQQTLWDDHRTAPRQFMERAFKGRRNQIVGDCVQLSTDVESYNDNSCPTQPIPMLWDFTDDVIESKQSGEFTEAEEIGDSSDFEMPSEQSRPVVLPKALPHAPSRQLPHPASPVQLQPGS